ncbi:hypothetical protein F1C16_05075 [Hymenobacter sp. NBH84]|uniref:hypothetical protein n=1 Tax=Hymenobacter sp. NBH84 TaxID=2596915 RepID=UPI001624BCA7|nr:hypothetical protein [Hymenobacter sp. NBH84]QNE38968.1 hypothetical protein F1C16_05075 [Hymenobacter sp. NBH84]
MMNIIEKFLKERRESMTPEQIEQRDKEYQERLEMERLSEELYDLEQEYKSNAEAIEALEKEGGNDRQISMIWDTQHQLEWNIYSIKHQLEPEKYPIIKGPSFTVAQDVVIKVNGVKVKEDDNDPF